MPPCLSVLWLQHQQLFSKKPPQLQHQQLLDFLFCPPDIVTPPSFPLFVFLFLQFTLSLPHHFLYRMFPIVVCPLKLTPVSSSLLIFGELLFTISILFYYLYYLFILSFSLLCPLYISRNFWIFYWLEKLYNFTSVNVHS